MSGDQNTITSRPFRLGKKKLKSFIMYFSYHYLRAWEDGATFGATSHLFSFFIHHGWLEAPQDSYSMMLSKKKMGGRKILILV